MHTKKMLAIGFTALILLTLTPFAIPISVAAPAQAIWVEPQDSGGLNQWDTFTVDIMVNVTSPTSALGNGLFGWEYKFKWNNTALNALLIDTHGDAQPGSDLLPGHTSVFVLNSTTDLGDGRDQHTYAVSMLTGTVFTGVASLCTYTFQVLQVPFFPQPDYVGLLDIQDSKLVDDDAVSFAHSVGDGTYTLLMTGAIEEPDLKLTPAPIVEGEFGKFFNVSIEIVDLNALWDLCGWEAKVSFNNTVLEAIDIFEGSFLPAFGGPNGTGLPVKIINNTLGLIQTAGLFYGNHTPPFGSGVLAILMFNATKEYEVPTEGSPPFDFPMDLFDVKLADCKMVEIGVRSVTDTVYRAPYYSLGWDLDCWTDPYRLFCETDILGLGPNATADAYSPQQFVKLYAYLQYNEYPEQNKDIWFVVSGPANPYDNITFVMSATTNASGVATINFTIPWPCEYAYEMVMGKWTCEQYAWVKNPWKPGYFEKVVDILKWDVGWIIDLIDVTVEPDPVLPCQELAITIEYKNIIGIPKTVLFTFAILDTLLDPIADLMMWKQVPAGEYCNPYYDTLTVYIHIPKWTHVGPGATVYVNAFSALPSECGLIFCPGVSVSFLIAKP